jgi:methyl-accepting chemotaxis protein
MKYNDLKIGTKLFLVFGMIIMIVLPIGLYTSYSILKISEYFAISELSLKINQNAKDAVIHKSEYIITDDQDQVKQAKTAISNARENVEKAKEKFSTQIDIGKFDEIIQACSDFEVGLDSYVANEKLQADLLLKIEASGTELQNLRNINDINLVNKSKQKIDSFNLIFLEARVLEKDYFSTKNENNINLFTDKINELSLIKLNNQNVTILLTEYKSYILDYIIKEKLQQEKINAIAEAESKVSQLTSEVVNKQSEVLSERIQLTLIVLLSSILIALILIVTFAEAFRRSLSKGIRKSVDYAKKVSIGDLAFDIDSTYLNRKDEIGELSLAMHTMVDKLKEVIESVSTGTANIATASEEMSANSQLVSQGSSEQASSVEEVSSSIEEMSSNIQQNSLNAMQTEKIANKASKDIEDANANVQLTINAIKEIASKVSIIGDIAFQTNILALNAAVEAARAGEHGRGFAVVASEVRKLAERSQSAANEINALSKSSVNYAINSGKVMADLVPDIQQTAKLVKEITAASVEQNSGAEQINYAIQQTNQVIQQNAAASEEMATSAEELESQAEQLQEIISFFKTSNTKNNIIQRRNTPVQQRTIKPSATKLSMNKGINLNMGKNDNLDKEYEKF